MTSSYFLKQGDEIRVSNTDNATVYDQLPPGNYVVKQDKYQMFYLEPLAPFRIPVRIYGDHQKDAQRILTTFRQRPNSTGVLMAGDKGSGKTMLAKMISLLGAEDQDLKLPTILVNSPFFGDMFNSFLNDITQPCIVLFDEFEKVYDSEKQEHILTVMDGVFSSRKLFLLTCNNLFAVDSHMRNRPGRIYYLMEFKGLDVNFIREYCQENLSDKQWVEKICTLAVMFGSFNFDMLQSLVEEMNRYGESPMDTLRMLNCKPDTESKNRFSIAIRIKGEEVPYDKLDDKEWTGNPLAAPFYVDYYSGENDSDYRQVHLNSGDIVKLDVDAGIFHFRNSLDEEVILKKQPLRVFDYGRL